MQLYEKLMCSFSELDYVFDHLMPQKQKGMIFNSTVYLNPNQSGTELNCTIAEEIGHYLTSIGDISKQDTNEKRKQERKARDIGATLVVTPEGIINCFENNCTSAWECAEFLDVTEETFKDAIKYYHRKHKIIKTENNYTIFFRCDGTVSVYKAFHLSSN